MAYTKPIYRNILIDIQEDFRVVLAHGGWMVQHLTEATEYVRFFGFSFRKTKKCWQPYEDYRDCSPDEEDYDWVKFFETKQEAETYLEEAIKQTAKFKYNEDLFNWRCEPVGKH